MFTTVLHENSGLCAIQIYLSTIHFIQTFLHSAASGKKKLCSAPLNVTELNKDT